MTRTEAREWLENALDNNDFLPETVEVFKTAIEALSADAGWEWGNRGEVIAKLDELRDEVYNEDYDGYTYARAIDMAIESLRADTVSRSQYQGLLNAIGKVYVEVVRCKDCIYWQSGDMGTGEIYEPYCEMLDTETEESAFCSDGKRREP